MKMKILILFTTITVAASFTLNPPHNHHHHQYHHHHHHKTQFEYNPEHHQPVNYPSQLGAQQPRQHEQIYFNDGGEKRPIWPSFRVTTERNVASDDGSEPTSIASIATRFVFTGQPNCRLRDHRGRCINRPKNRK